MTDNIATVTFNITSFELNKSTGLITLYLNEKQHYAFQSIKNKTPLLHNNKIIQFEEYNLWCPNCKIQLYGNEYCKYYLNNDISNYNYNCSTVYPSNYNIDKLCLTVNSKTSGCIHKRKSNMSTKNVLSVVVSLKKDKNRVSVEHVLILFRVRKLLNICAHTVAKQIFKSEMYMMNETEMDPSKLLFLRNLKKTVNRDILNFVQKKVRKYRKSEIEIDN